MGSCTASWIDLQLSNLTLLGEPEATFTIHEEMLASRSRCLAHKTTQMLSVIIIERLFKINKIATEMEGFSVGSESAILLFRPPLINYLGAQSKLKQSDCTESRARLKSLPYFFSSKIGNFNVGGFVNQLIKKDSIKTTTTGSGDGGFQLAWCDIENMVFLWRN
jgi:hypothetical protein